MVTLSLTAVVGWISTLGAWPFVMIATALVSLVLWRRRARTYLLPLWITLLGTELVVLATKLAFHRTRPEAALTIYYDSPFSFPSNHAALAVAFYGFLAYLVWRLGKHRWWKVTAVALAVVLIALIGFSRLYLGVHYARDAWGGYLIGALGLLTGIRVAEAWRLSRNHHRAPGSTFGP